MGLKESYICYGCRWCGRAEFDDQEDVSIHFLEEHGDDRTATEHYGLDPQILIDKMRILGVEPSEELLALATIVKVTEDGDEE